MEFCCDKKTASTGSSSKVERSTNYNYVSLHSDGFVVLIVMVTVNLNMPIIIFITTYELWFATVEKWLLVTMGVQRKKNYKHYPYTCYLLYFSNVVSSPIKCL